MLAKAIGARIKAIKALGLRGLNTGIKKYKGKRGHAKELRDRLME